MTAEEILVINNVFNVIGADTMFNLQLSRDGYVKTQQNIKKAVLEYAKIKCEELLEIVAEKANIKTENTGEINEILVIDKDSILNAVDLDEFIR